MIYFRELRGGMALSWMVNPNPSVSRKVSLNFSRYNNKNNNNNNNNKPCRRTIDASAVEGKNQERLTPTSGDPRIQAALLRQVGLYCSGQKTSLAARGTAMMIRKQDNTQPGRRKEQRSSDSTEENGNHTEET